MKFQCPRGTRDFYPPEMAVRNFIVDRWRRVSHRNGFEEYDGPIFESLDLYRIKSGEAIVSELFHFEDRGGREFAIRPEMTPTLARMVAAKAASLPRPIKWFSAPRLCRAERPQRGRLREFFQWNIDILGGEGVLSDAECVFVAADFFRDCGLTTDHVVIKINSRAMLAAILENADIAPQQFDAIYAILDRRDKIDPSAFQKMIQNLNLTAGQTEMLLSLGDAKGPDGLRDMRSLLVGHTDGLSHVDDTERLFELLATMGVADFCTFDMGVVRGLAYYTGMVFEAFGKLGLQRAICGGGRYDQLLAAVGGPSMSGTGFATSDVVIQDLLGELNLLPVTSAAVDIFVIDGDPSAFDFVLTIVTSLRKRNVAAAFSYKRQAVGKQFKQAAAKSAHHVIVVDAESPTTRLVQVKNLATGLQQEVPVDRIIQDPFVQLSE